MRSLRKLNNHQLNSYDDVFDSSSNSQSLQLVISVPLFVLDKSIIGARVLVVVLPSNQYQEAKVIAIKEVNNLETLTLDELIGSLLTHELMLNDWVEEAKNEKKKVDVALKSTTNKNSESSEEVDEDREMAMFARRFKIFLRSNRGRMFQKKE
ncbi:hypothetical protein J1N35_019236 [Gossypium stocksii]|uniref:UBN2 domain-containing protein n=1 Tax=Gossypium stocksii TaxID=47602 RepID=A0A9D3VQJ6_9ROSI|nr:hypothetical protein J1N35_019236 [Gossypium stocksii]